jgi:serine/threonine protein kinase
MAATKTTNWTGLAESPYPWERDALDFVRERFPDHEPWRAWSLFEFIALDGSVNEVDLLIFAPWGFFLVEIKSRPGRLTGDAGTWTWETDGRLTSTDNPLKLANTKAKKLAELLNHQAATRRTGKVPFIEPLVFLSAPDLRCDLTGTGRLRVCLRDRDDGPSPRPGIMAALQRRECPGLTSLPGRAQLDKPMAKLVARAIDQAGIRASNRQRRVSDYQLEEQIDEGRGWQDWLARHTLLPDSKRRIRIYPVRLGESEERKRVEERAAIREYQLIENLQSPGILRALQCTPHELGPAVIFEHDPSAIRLDHFLLERDRELSLSTRVDLVRQLAEVMQYAHKRRVVHRTLSPRSVLVVDADSARPRLKVFNWQAGYRAAAEGGPSSSSGAAITATSHVGMLVDDPTTAYMAPDVLVAGDSLGEHLDVFSLGAVTYHILSGKPPAADGVELASTIRTTRGLQLASVLDGATPALCELVQYATHPDVSSRLDTVTDFLTLLDDAENQLTSPFEEYTENPSEAVAGDILPGNLRVERRIGQGSCSTALLVTRPASDPKNAEEFILKVASEAEHGERVRAEADVLRTLGHDRDHRIVGFVEAVEIGDHAGFLMKPVFTDTTSKRIETLGMRIRKEGRLHLELLERLGSDLIDVVRILEKRGVSHRDIKPDNIAVGAAGRDHALSIVLFDFSLTSVPPENIRAGTIGYLDPLLPVRRPPPRYDSYAERYAVAATLHEMATGTLPKWGDGRSDPSQIEAEATIDADLFDTDVRENLARFFRRAFRRDIALRFDNAEQMLAEWKACFAGIRSGPVTDGEEDDDALRRLLAPATLETPIATLGLGTRATNALDRANVLTVRHLLACSRSKFDRMPGVGAKTRREITAVVAILRDRLLPNGTLPPLPPQGSDEPAAPPTVIATETRLEETPADPATLSVDAIAAPLLQPPRGTKGDNHLHLAEALLGRHEKVAEPWPTQVSIAAALGLTRARIGQILGKLLAATAKSPPFTSLRGWLVDAVSSQGGVATADEVAELLLAARGSELPVPLARRTALGLLRIALDTERQLAAPRLVVRRDGAAILVAKDEPLADWAVRLGSEARGIAVAEPLAAPAKVVERLRAIEPPPGVTIESDSRLVRLAAAASQVAAVSSRLELYPRGMDAGRALKLSIGAVAGAKQLSEEQLRERVTSRYPEAAPLPSRPELDTFLATAGLDLTYDASSQTFVAPILDRPSVTSGSTYLPRFPTALSGSHPPAVPGSTSATTPPEVADARAFEERLARAIQNGTFLQLVVTPREYDRTADELARRFAVAPIDVEQVVLDALRETAESLQVDWNLVLAADESTSSPDWQNLRQLVECARPLIAARLVVPDSVALLLYADILVRYGLKSLLADLYQRIGSQHGPQGVWLLLPGSHVPLIDGQPVGVTGQQAVVPDAWLQNLHRTTRPTATAR